MVLGAAAFVIVRALLVWLGRALVGSGLALSYASSAQAQATDVDAGALDAASVASAAAVAEAGALPNGNPSNLLPTAEPSGDNGLVTIRARVLGKGDKDPLVGAAITLGLQVIAEADENGRIEISLTPGTHRLQIQQPGYEPLDVVVEARRGRSMDEESIIRLSPRLVGERYETVVVPKDLRADRITLRQEELTRTPGTLGDPLRVIEVLPGVSQVVWPAAMYTVRGANPGNTGFFLDGVRMPSLYHFALGPSVIHPFFIEQVDFYPGGYPARYGRYVSGIVAVKTTQPKVDRPHGSVDVRLLDAGGIVATPINNGRGSVAVAGRVSYTGLLLSLLSPDLTFNYWDYQTRLEHKLGPGKLTLFVFGSGDHIGRKDGTKQDIFANISTHRFTVRWNGTVGKGRLEASTLVGRDSSSTFIPELNNLPVSVKSLISASRIGYERALSAKLDLDVGADLEVQSFAPQSVATPFPPQNLLANRTSILSGSYASLVYRPAPWFSIAPGLRYDLLAQEGVTRFEPGPRANARLRIGARTWLKAAGGRFVQLPSLPVTVPGFENFGLKSIGTQSSIQGSFGAETAMPWDLTLDTTAFYQRLRVSDLASIFTYEVQTNLLELRDGRSYGLEVLVRRDVSKQLYGWLSYTLSKSERVYPPLNTVAPSDWDQRHILNLVASYRLRKGYQIGGRIHYNTGRPYPVFNEGSLAASGNSGASILYGKLPDFYQVDLRFDRRWVFDRYTLDFYLELINTTLTQQVFDMKRRPDGSIDRRGFRIALPSIGLHAEW